MKKISNNKIIYSINVSDIQDVAQQLLERNLTKEEIIKVGDSVGDYLDWFQAIENAIHQHITD
jgi:hypothetical protein